MKRFAVILLLCLIGWLAATPSAAVTFPWKARFTKASSPELAAIHEQIHAAHSDALTAYRIQNQTWKEEDFTLEIESGMLYVEPPVGGIRAGAFFEGKAVFSFKPRSEGARGNLRVAFGRPTLERVAVDTAYLFSLRPDSPLTGWTSAQAVTSSPSKESVYIADKSAMRQLGLELTSVFLNREGPASNTTYVLLPMQEIRKSGSTEARVMYRMNPTAGLSIGFAVFGHQELTPVRPFKFMFHTLVSYSGSRPAKGVADVEQSSVKVVPAANALPASEEATVRMKLAEGVKAVRLMFTPWMEVSRIAGADGNPVQFLQWDEMKTQVEMDPSLLILLVEGATQPGGSAASITVSSTGRLFEPWGNLFLLTAEDGWYPRLHSHDDAHHELEMTIPKEMVGIGIGEKVLEEVVGQKKRVVFRTTQPNDGSIFYYGRYTKHEAAVAGVTVELYLDDKDIVEQKNARRVLGELTGALGFFSETLGPLDIKTLRAVSTPTLHARGFEGLILMGQMGRQTNAKVWADVSRAHEVAHQWFGNYVRIKYWPRDRWLLEALAEYMGMEFYRTSAGEGRALEAIKTQWFEPLTFGTMERKNLAGQKEELTGSTAMPLVAATQNVYTKGPMVLHMLRHQFRLQKDDASFFAMLRDFLQSYKYQPVSSDDFKAVAEKHLESDLDWFFRQWVTDGGIPVLVWHADWTAQGSGWVVNLQGRQEQRNYRLNVPVRLHLPSGKIETRDWSIDGESPSAVLETAEKPVDVTLNDDMAALVILKRMKAR